MIPISEEIPEYVEFLKKDICKIGDILPYLKDEDLVLYHYTTIEALNNILSTNTFWISKSDYLNDKSELDFISPLISEILEKNARSIAYQPVSDLLLGIFNAAKRFYNNTYIFSLSKNPDSLPLWSYYSQNSGYNIGIDIKDFLCILHSQNLMWLEDGVYRYNWHFGPVVYDSATQTNMVNDAIDFLLSIYERLGPGQDFTNYSNKAILQLFACNLFFKNKSFAPEEEYRLVLILTAVGMSSVNKHRILHGAFIPYIDLKFDMNRIPIKELYIGPSINSDYAKKGILSFLKSNGYEIAADKVISSSIPLRY